MRSQILMSVGVSVLLSMACSGASDDGGDEAGNEETGGSGGTNGDVGTTGGDPSDDGETTLDPSDPTAEDGSTGAPGTEDTGEPPAELECAAYCTTYMDGCADYNAYANEEDCMAHCGQWPVGTAEDTAGDTLGCRLYHATVAGTAEPDVHCPHASPDGAAVCVDGGAPTCSGYCDAYFDNCTDDLNAYTDLDDCMSQCAPWYPGKTDDVAGNTIGCRTYHAGAPAVGDPELHCPHAGPGGADVCVFP